MYWHECGLCYDCHGDYDALRLQPTSTCNWNEWTAQAVYSNAIVPNAMLSVSALLCRGLSPARIWGWPLRRTQTWPPLQSSPPPAGSTPPETPSRPPRGEHSVCSERLPGRPGQCPPLEQHKDIHIRISTYPFHWCSHHRIESPHIRRESVYSTNVPFNSTTSQEIHTTIKRNIKYYGQNVNVNNTHFMFLSNVNCLRLT